MKKQLSLLALASVITLAFAQTTQSQTKEQEKTVPINDMRNLGIVKAKNDTSTAGHKENDVVIDRTLTLKHKGDTTGTYRIHYFKTSKNKLVNFSASYTAKEDYDKASYTSWMADTIHSVSVHSLTTDSVVSINITSVLSVTLINSVTNKKKDLKITDEDGQTSIEWTDKK